MILTDALKKKILFLSVLKPIPLTMGYTFQTKCYISLEVFANSFSGGKSTIEIHSSITKQKLDMKEKEQKANKTSFKFIRFLTSHISVRVIAL